jgi:mannose-6-phosphate isomerase-like protein (cupin superfamily)
MQAFDLAHLFARRVALGTPYLEFLKVPGMSLGLYTLAVGATDRQTPHAEDEAYYVVSGRARVRVADDDRAVEPGAIVFVPARVPHHFHTIEKELTLLVFFAPAEGTGLAPP